MKKTVVRKYCVVVISLLMSLFCINFFAVAGDLTPQDTDRMPVASGIDFRSIGEALRPIFEAISRNIEVVEVSVEIAIGDGVSQEQAREVAEWIDEATKYLETLGYNVSVPTIYLGDNGKGNYCDGSECYIEDIDLAVVASKIIQTTLQSSYPALGYTALEAFSGYFLDDFMSKKGGLRQDDGTIYKYNSGYEGLTGDDIYQAYERYNAALASNKQAYRDYRQAHRQARRDYREGKISREEYIAIRRELVAARREARRDLVSARDNLNETIVEVTNNFRALHQAMLEVRSYVGIDSSNELVKVALNNLSGRANPYGRDILQAFLRADIQLTGGSNSDIILQYFGVHGVLLEYH